MLKGKENIEKRSLQNEWLANSAVDDTLGEKKIIPNLHRVIQPTPENIKGEDLREFPAYIALEITNVCNLQCKHCNYRYGLEHYTRERGFAKRETVEKVLYEVKEHGARVLMNYDGEPLMHKEFLEYLRLATNIGVNTYFNTNGTLFNKQFADELLNFYNGSIFFSIDGNRKWFEKIRVPANYDQVIGNLNYFLEANAAHGWPITVGVSLCNLGQTADERKEFLDEWLPKVNYVSMGEVNDKCGAMISNPMTKMEVKKRPICCVPWDTCGVCHNGDVIPCSIHITRANTTNAIFGNIHEKSLKEIWQGAEFNEFRKMAAEERYQGTYCEKCERWLAQFDFPDKVEGNTKIRHNGYWTTFQNMDKGNMNFEKHLNNKKIEQQHD